MKFELEDSLRGAPDDELLDDLRRCAKVLGRDTISIEQFAELGRVHPSTIQRRFGSWNRALSLAGLQPSRSKIGISNEELFEDVKRLWISLGRQPRYSEMRAPNSKYSADTFADRFGSWSKGLREFVEWVNSEPEKITPEGADVEGAEQPTPVEGNANPKRRTRREISDRQRFRTLVRDGFRCKTCGANPLSKPGTELHVDHLVPWSKGGETVDENLSTKCEQCNLGKGAAFNF